MWRFYTRTYYALTNKQFIKEDIEVLKNNLSEEHFIISVCGQVKAGKSTFLNYILFNGEEILPTDPTPCTAKLAKISYCEEEYAEIYFYTSQEWDKLKCLKVTEEEGREVNYFDEYLKEFVEHSAMEGVYDRQFIKDERYSVKIKKLKGIKDYVSKDGVCTPFVSHIDINIKNELIKNAIIVDTPGINDSNELRSRITEEWISQSNAILMLMYSGQALAKADLDFIDKHLSTVPSEKILFALSKADIIEGGMNGVKDFVRKNLINNPSLKERKLLDDKDVYPISTIAAIINYKNKNGINLTEDEEFYQENIDEDIIEKQGYIPILYKAIEKYVMNDKGTAIINSAKSQIRGICKAKIDSLQIEIEVELQTKGHLMQSSEEKEHLKVEIKDLMVVIENEKQKYSDELDNIIKTKLNDALKKQNKFKDNTVKEYEKWLLNKNIDEIIKGTMFEVKNLLDNNIPIFLEEILDYEFMNKIDNLIKDYIISFKQKTKNIIPTRLDYIFYPAFDVFMIADEIKKEASKTLAVDQLKKLKERVWGFLWTKKNNSTTNIKNCVYKSIDDSNNMLYNKISDQLYTIKSQIVTKVYSNMNSYLNKLKNELEEIDQKFADNDKKIEEINERIKVNEELLTELEKELDYIKAIIG